MDTNILWTHHARPGRAHAAIWLAAAIASVALVGASLACSAGSSTSGSGAPTEAAIAAPTEAAFDNSSGGGAGNTAGSINDIDPCDILAQPDATSFFQTPANAGVKNVGSNSASCTYSSSANGDQLTINILYEDGAAKDSSDFTSVRTSDTEPVPNLGDDAYYNKAFFLLTVAKGHWMFTLNGAHRGTNVTKDELVQMANFVLLKFQQKGLN